MDLSFDNNQTWTLTVDISQYKPLFPLSVCTFHMQVREAPGVIRVIYAWSSRVEDEWGSGTITYIDPPGLLSFTAPYSDMIKLVPGNYEWDLALIDPDEFVKILTGGALVINGGITLQ